MMEHIREEQLALYSTGDLAPGSEVAVTAHVQDCEMCRSAVSGFRETQSFLASALIDPAAGELVEVRERVNVRLRERRAWHRRWAWPVGAAAALALILAGIERRPAVLPKPVVPVAQLASPEMPRLQIPRLVLHTPRVRHRDAGLRSVDLVARADQPALIKMTTADPNVVILWQSNEGVKNE